MQFVSTCRIFLYCIGAFAQMCGSNSSSQGFGVGPFDATSLSRVLNSNNLAISKWLLNQHGEYMYGLSCFNKSAVSPMFIFPPEPEPVALAICP